MSFFNSNINDYYLDRNLYFPEYKKDHWVGTVGNPPGQRNAELEDPWHWFLPLMYAENAIVVCSSGNNGLDDDDTEVASQNEWSPARFAQNGFSGHNKLVVVGSSNAQDKISISSNRFHSIITTHAPGVSSLSPFQTARSFHVVHLTKEVIYQRIYSLS